MDRGGNNKFIRFQLEDKDYGNCGSDRRARHGAPYWERAELKQTTGLNRNLKYELEFNINLELEVKLVGFPKDMLNEIYYV